MSASKDQAVLDREAQFKAKLAGIPAHHIVQAYNSLQHGTDFSRCSKTHMAEAWARDDDRMSRTVSFKHVDLDVLEARARARWRGRIEWRTAEDWK
jgi:hypothetical protein